MKTFKTFEYKGHKVCVETSQEYTWTPVRFVFSVNGRYEFKPTVKASNRRLLKFRSERQAENAAKRMIDAGDI